MGVVRLRAIKKIGKKAGLFVTATEWNGTFITGQHIIPGDPSTNKNLTPSQILGETPLTQEQVKMFPHVIYGGKLYKFSDLQSFDKDDPVGKALYDFISLNTKDIVAKTKKDVVRGKHEFYFEDKEAEAAASVNEGDLWYEALSKIKQCTPEKQQKIALLLSYRIPSFRVDPFAISATRLLEQLYGVCKSNPQDVVQSFSSDMDDHINILLAVKYGILNMKDGKFYDNTKYIGTTIEDVVEKLIKDEMLRSRIIVELERKSGKKRIPTTEILQAKYDKISGLILRGQKDDALKEFESIDDTYKDNPVYDDILWIVQNNILNANSFSEDHDDSIDDYEKSLSSLSLEELANIPTHSKQREKALSLSSAGLKEDLIKYLVEIKKKK